METSALYANSDIMAIILSGPGGKLYPLTENLPKALLPVGNKPLLAYGLEWLEKARIKDIIILTYPKWRETISNYLSKVYECSEENNIHVIDVPPDTGTADALRSIKAKIKSDFLVMSCDLITQVLPHVILDPHRTLNPTMTVMLYDSTKFQAVNEKSVSKDDDSLEFIGIDDSSSRLLFSASQADLDDELDIRLSLLQKFPRVHFYSQLRDSHLYIFKKWVIDVIAKSKSISSIRLDLVPLLLECQYRSNLVHREGIDKLLKAHRDPFVQAYAYSSHGQKKDGVVCTAVICRDSLSARLNKRSTYADMNKYVVKDATSRIAMNAEISLKTQVGQDSMVGDGSKIGDRCSVKKSVVGSHCTIGQNVKINGSIIMDYVTIEDGVSLMGCIVCNGAVIQRLANLKDCDVGSKYVVPKESKSRF